MKCLAEPHFIYEDIPLSHQVLIVIRASDEIVLHVDFDEKHQR